MAAGDGGFRGKKKTSFCHCLRKECRRRSPKVPKGGRKRERLKKNWKERFSELRSVQSQTPSPSPFNYLSVVTVTSFQYVFFYLLSRST